MGQPLVDIVFGEQAMGLGHHGLVRLMSRATVKLMP
jgi:hypothetical protein